MEYRIVVIPDKYFSIIKFKQEGHLGIGSINTALQDFEPKVIFPWHLSLMIKLEETIENGMPTNAEFDLIDSFESQVETALNKVDEKSPNALFLARISWNETVELIWRIHNPETANSEIQNIIKNNAYPRYFDYRIDPDKNWDLAKWHLKDYEDTQL